MKFKMYFMHFIVYFVAYSVYSPVMRPAVWQIQCTKQWHVTAAA